MPDLELIKIVLNFGALGLLGWIVFILFARTLPRFEERLDRTVERLEAALLKQHADCNAMLAAQQQKFGEDLTAFREMHERAFTRLTNAIAKRDQPPREAS